MMRRVLMVFLLVVLLFLAFSTVYSGVHQANLRFEETQNSTKENPSVFFDKSVYCPDVNVFWNRSASLMSVRIIVEDKNIDSGFVNVSIFSSVDAKIVTLAKTAPGRFEGLTQVNCLRFDESVSNVELCARYGDVIIARYLDQANATAFVAFPRYVLKEVLNAPWPSSWEWFDSEGVIQENYWPPIGIQYNPSMICHYALCNYYMYLTTGNLTFREIFLVQANWLVRNAVKKGNFSVWEYKFDWEVRNCTAPWVSAMAQGEGLNVLIRAYVLTGNTTYLDVAQTVMRSFGVEMTLGGVRHTDSDGVWYEEYADTGAISSKVLNGFIYSLYGLFEYSFATNSSEGFKLFYEGTHTLSSNLYRYDTGSWSYYDLQYYSNASQDYQWLHVVQLRTLYKITGDQTFKEYSDRFNTYMQRARVQSNRTGPSLEVDDALNQVNATLGLATGSVITVNVTVINHAASPPGSGEWLTGVFYKEVGGSWLTPLEKVTIFWSPDGSTWWPASTVWCPTSYPGYDFELIIGAGGYIPIGFNSTTYIKTIFNYNVDPTQVEVIVFEDINANGRYDQGEPILSTGDFPVEIDLGVWRTVELEPIMFFDSIQAAISAAGSGQTIYVYDGIYLESLVINTPLNLIGSGNAVIDGGGTIMYPMKINTGPVLVQGFTFQNIKREMEAIYIWVHGVSAPVMIQFNHFIGLHNPNIADHGVFAESTLPGGRCIIQYNEFEGMWKGVLLELAQGSASILHNKFHNLIYGNDEYGIPYYGAEGVCATTYDGKDVSELLAINNNEFYDYRGMSIAISGPYPDLPAAKWTNVEIKNNRIESIGLGSYPEPYGISLTNGITSGDPSQGGVNSVIISNNTLLGAGAAASIGIRMLGSHSNVTMTKNIICRLGTGVLVTKRAAAPDTPEWYTSNLVVNFNNISSSTSYGFNNIGPNVIDARFNWWGDTTGPYHATTNPAGLGNAVSDNVNYSPWRVASFPGDIDNDGKVDSYDLFLFASAYNSKMGESRYNLNADFDNDGNIDYDDLTIFSLNYGKNCLS